MDPETTNYLYRHPQLYDSVFKNAPTGPKLKNLSLALLRKYGKEPPSTVLDIGCGTGFKLAHLQQAGYRCTGVDYLEQMVEYARGEYAGIEFGVGDVRTLRLGRTFDVITSLGWVIENVRSRDEVSGVMRTFAAHAEPGTLLVFDTHNPIGDLHASGSRSEFSFDRDGFTASGTATFEVDRRHQLLTRRRTWELSDGSVENDVARFRLFFPMELEHYLDTHGFDVLDMYDNTDLNETDLDGSMLYVTARYRGNPEARS